MRKKVLKFVFYMAILVTSLIVGLSYLSKHITVVKQEPISVMTVIRGNFYPARYRYSAICFDPTYESYYILKTDSNGVLKPFARVETYVDEHTYEKICNVTEL